MHIVPRVPYATGESPLAPPRDRGDVAHPPLGLVLGNSNRELGVRTDETPPRTWQLSGTPPDWSHEFLCNLLATQTSLEAPEITHRLVRGKKCTWWIRAAPGKGGAAQQLSVEEDEGTRACWISPSFAKPRTRRQGEPLQPGTLSFKREVFVADKPQQASTANNVEATAEGNARPAPAGKKPAAATVRVRKILEGLTKQVIPSDGPAFKGL